MSTETIARQPLGRRLMGGAYDLSGAETAAEARAAAGLDWEAVHRPLYVDLPGDQGLALVEKERAVVRDDNCAMLGVVGAEHQMLSNADFFDFADVLLSEADQTWVNADPVGGSLSGGRLPFLCLQLGEGVQVAGVDAVNCAVLLADGKVGNASIVGNVSPLRVGCGNVVRSSLRRLGVASFKVQHSGDLAEKMAAARAGLAVTAKYMVEFAAMANAMADIAFTAADFDGFLAELLPIADDAGDKAKRTNAAKRGAFRLNWNQTTTLTPDLKATAWGALNVVTEVLDHGATNVRKSKIAPAERRMNDVNFGTSAGIRDRAFGLLVPA